MSAIGARVDTVMPFGPFLNPEVEALFDSARYLVLAASVDGNNSAAPFLCRRDGPTLVFMCWRGARVAAQIAINPLVQAVILGDSPADPKAAALEVTGHCHTIRDRSERERIAHLLLLDFEAVDLANYAVFRLLPTRLALVDPLGASVHRSQRVANYELTDTREAMTAVEGFMRLWIRAIRAPFFAAAIIPVILGGAVAWAGMARLGTEQAFSWPLMLWCLLGSILAAAGTNLVNDYGDDETGADDPNEATGNPLTGGSRTIQLGLAAPWKIFAAGLGCFVLMGLVGLHINALIAGAPLAPSPLFLFGLAGATLGIAYTVGPFRLSYRGYGELAVALGFGPVILLGTLYVLSHAAKIVTPWAVGVLAALPISVFVLLILWINQFQDAGGDSASGKRTWVVRLAEKSAGFDFTLPFRVYVVLNVMGFGFVAVIVVLGFFAPALGTPFAALALLAVPLFVRAQKLGAAWVKQWASRIDSPAERRRLFFSLLPVNALTISIHAAAGILLAVGYIISGYTAL